MARYLQRSAEAQAGGLVAAEAGGEVVPFEATPVQTVDPQLAWVEALAAIHHFQPGTDTQSWKAPPDWPMLVSAHEPTVALAFSLCNYPQLVRHLQPLLRDGKRSQLRPSGGRPVNAPELLRWAVEPGGKDRYPQMLLALGALRLGRQFNLADELLQQHRQAAPAKWQAALANEEAALAWHRGQAEEALDHWQKQADSVPVLFNRGMAALFMDRRAEARFSLGQVVGQLPENGAWHHLGRLYLALAEMRD